jgi:hypothetical protein
MGLHSNIPVCCVSYFIHDALRLGPQYHQDSVSVGGKKANYRMCPVCRVMDNVQELHECAKSNPECIRTFRVLFRGDPLAFEDKVWSVDREMWAEAHEKMMDTDRRFNEGKITAEEARAEFDSYWPKSPIDKQYIEHEDGSLEVIRLGRREECESTDGSTE